MSEYQPMDAAQLEQMARGLRDFARATKAQYDAFVEAGFTETQALRLTGEWIRATAGGGS